MPSCTNPPSSVSSSMMSSSRKWSDWDISVDFSNGYSLVHMISKPWANSDFSSILNTFSETLLILSLIIFICYAYLLPSIFRTASAWSLRDYSSCWVVRQYNLEENLLEHSPNGLHGTLSDSRTTNFLLYSFHLVGLAYFVLLWYMMFYLKNYWGISDFMASFKSGMTVALRGDLSSCLITVQLNDRFG